MMRRIGLWALCGFAVALVWAMVFYAAGPSSGYYPSQGAVLHYLGHSVLLRITVPVALRGGPPRHHVVFVRRDECRNLRLWGLDRGGNPAGGAIEQAAAAPLSPRTGSD